MQDRNDPNREQGNLAQKEMLRCIEILKGALQRLTEGAKVVMESEAVSEMDAAVKEAEAVLEHVGKTPWIGKLG